MADHCSMTEEEIATARAKWRYRGQTRPPWAIEPQAGQESLWDYPRPPSVDPSDQLVEIKTADGVLVSSSRRTVRIKETAGAPTYYIPPDDVKMELLAPEQGCSFCEWKGSTSYWSVKTTASVIRSACWSYPHPLEGYEAVKGYIGFYPGKLECYVDGERVSPQPGEFYGGWVTHNIVGPMKGAPGTGWW